MADIIQIRRDTAANWTSANPTLAQGELGVETDTDKIKIGDGSTAWTSLGYLIDTGGYAPLASPTFTGTVTADGLQVGSGAAVRTIETFGSVPSWRLNDTDVSGLYHEFVGTAAGTVSLRIDHANVDSDSDFDISVDGAVVAVFDSTGIDITGTVTADGLSFSDNDKAQFGNSNDLQIYHSGSNSYIDDVGTGNLFVRAENLRLSNSDNSQYYLIADNSGFVKLNYSGSTKLETTATGIDVTGTVTATSYTDTVYSLSGTALDPANGGIQTKTLAANTTFTDSLASGESLVLQLEAGASYTVTWPTITWVTSGGNTAPTLTAKDTLVFWKVSSTLYGAYTGSYV